MRQIDIESCKKMFDASREKLNSAKKLHEACFFSDAISRAYYAVFHILSLLLYCKGKTYSRHSQLIGDFNKEYIKPGIFPKNYGKAITNLYDGRQTGDYDVFVQFDEIESKKAIKDAEEIINGIKKYIEKEYCKLD